MIDTATNTVVATVPVGGVHIAITPDGKHAYVANPDSNTVSVIDTASNTVVATVPVGGGHIAITPDGKHAYVGDVVIDTASNKVVAAIPLPDTRPFPSFVTAVGIVPPPPGVPFLAFNAKLAIQFGSIPTKDAFGFGSNFTLSSTDSNGINPSAEAVTL